MSKFDKKAGVITKTVQADLTQPVEKWTGREWLELGKSAGHLPANTTREQVAAIVLTGKDLGLGPMQSLATMCFIKGRLAMEVEAQLAVARRGGVRLPKGWLKEEDGSCTVTLARGEEDVTITYTIEDAKKAGLLYKDNYKHYPRQMLRWRAIGDALRLLAPDLILGLLAPIEAETLDPVDHTEARTREKTESLTTRLRDYKNLDDTEEEGDIFE